MDGLLHFEFETQFEVCDAFIRIQEFYESSFSEIKGQAFSVDYYSTIYAEKFGNFTYHTDWNGFNVPGDVAIEWYEVFKKIGFRESEKKIVEAIQKYIEEEDNIYFYLIGCEAENQEVMSHEYAHAYYYLDDSYTHEASDIVNNLNNAIYNKLEEKLCNMGYSEEVLIDEIQAYLATSTEEFLTDRFELTDTELKDIRDGKTKLEALFNSRYYEPSPFTAELAKED